MQRQVLDGALTTIRGSSAAARRAGQSFFSVLCATRPCPSTAPSTDWRRRTVEPVGILHKGDVRQDGFPLTVAVI